MRILLLLRLLPVLLLLLVSIAFTATATATVAAPPSLHRRAVVAGAHRSLRSAAARGRSSSAPPGPRPAAAPKKPAPAPAPATRGGVQRSSSTPARNKRPERTPAEALTYNVRQDIRRAANPRNSRRTQERHAAAAVRRVAGAVAGAVALQAARGGPTQNAVIGLGATMPAMKDVTLAQCIGAACAALANLAPPPQARRKT
ncbi:hypothetical protein HDU96_006369 [Phlyctochytrium bullatum]|nr:hypothetical protein HDU96_006369 [Phlyctochytrium bullatum]